MKTVAADFLASNGIRLVAVQEKSINARIAIFYVRIKPNNQRELYSIGSNTIAPDAFLPALMRLVESVSEDRELGWPIVFEGLGRMHEALKEWLGCLR